MLRADRLSAVGSNEVGDWSLVGMPTHAVEFEALARRAAIEIRNPASTDLLTAWLEALIKHGGARFSSEIINAGKNPNETVREHVTGSLYKLPELSANYCKMLESAALQSEFEEKQRNDPKNWSQFRQQYEAFRSIKEVISEHFQTLP